MPQGPSSAGRPSPRAQAHRESPISAFTRNPGGEMAVPGAARTSEADRALGRAVCRVGGVSAAPDAMPSLNDNAA